MSSSKHTKYYCDLCGKTLPTDSNHLAIVTSKSEHSIGWSRLRVTVEHHHGSHNYGETDQADLCQKCAMTLLEDALARIKKGERVRKGVDAIDMLKWNQPF